MSDAERGQIAVGFMVENDESIKEVPFDVEKGTVEET